MNGLNSNVITGKCSGCTAYRGKLEEARKKLAAVGRYSSELWAQPHGPRQREIVKDLDRILKGGN